MTATETAAAATETAAAATRTYTNNAGRMVWVFADTDGVTEWEDHLDAAEVLAMDAAANEAE